MNTAFLELARVFLLPCVNLSAGAGRKGQALFLRKPEVRF